MRTKSTSISWIAVLGESALAGWSRGSGTVQTLPRPAVGRVADLWKALRPLLPTRRGAAGLILSADAYTQSLRIPDRQTAGLPEADLHRLLAFEAEPFSQIAPDDAVLTCNPGEPDAGGSRSWEIAEFPRSDASQLLRIARADHLRISAFGPVPAEWRNASPADWQTPAAAEFLAAIADAPPTLLVPASAAAPDSGSFTSLRGNLRQNALAAALLLCLAAYFILDRAESSARRRLADREISAQRLQQLQQEAQSIRRQIEETGDARRNAERAASRLARFRAAWSSLLDGLTDAGEGGSVIQRISANGPFTAKIDAYCSDPAEPARAMDRLAEATAETGWEIHPGALQSGSASGIVRYSFTAELKP